MIDTVGLEEVMVVANDHMEKMNLEYLVVVVSNDGEEVMTYDPQEAVSCHPEIGVVVVGA